LICHSYIVCGDGISDDSDTAEESTGGHESDVDRHNDFNNMSQAIGVEREDEIVGGEASCNRHVHEDPPESWSKHVEGSSKGGSTGNEMVEIIQLVGGVSVNEDIPEHGRPSLNTIYL